MHVLNEKFADIFQEIPAKRKKTKVQLHISAIITKASSYRKLTFAGKISADDFSDWPAHRVDFKKQYRKCVYVKTIPSDIDQKIYKQKLPIVVCIHT